MSSTWRKMMVHLGLGDDEDYDDFDDKAPVRGPVAVPNNPGPMHDQVSHARPVSSVSSQPSTVHMTRPTPVPNTPQAAAPQRGPSMRFPDDAQPPHQPTVHPVAAETEGVRAVPAQRPQNQAPQRQPQATQPQQAAQQPQAQPQTPPAVSGVRTIPNPNTKPLVVAPRSFADAQIVGDTFKAKQPVIINLQGIDRDLSRRLVDFTSGLCYGVGGQMEKVATDVFLLTPVDVEVSPEERQRLAERGLYD